MSNALLTTPLTRFLIPVRSMASEIAKPNYRFKCEIVDDNTGETVLHGSAPLGTIHADGSCEFVDMEVGSLLRAFENKYREQYEAKHYSQEEETEE